MEAARTIRDAVDAVARLRALAASSPGLAAAIGDVKRLQARRFAGTYPDLLRAGIYQAASRFFLEELYSDKDYTLRDAQFARIASAIETLFPAKVVGTAVSLAQLHALTEQLDHRMAQAWLAQDVSKFEARRYCVAWQEVDARGERERQLASVLALGHELLRLTRTPGLRTMLRMMRGPASAAGLSSLQGFLERGFDTFAAMARERGAGEAFLRIVEERESALLVTLSEADLVACETELARILGQAR